MKNELNNYQIATKIFLERFDYYWKEAIDSLEVQSPQLAVGNRLRPQICLWGYLATLNQEEILQHDYNLIANMAVSIEMVHKASLLVDDWIDNDAERHGDPTFHIEFGPQQTVLFALNMIGNSMHRIENSFSKETVLPHNYYLCLITIIHTVCAMAKGALDELKLQKDDVFNTKIIREITQLETAEIIGNSMLLGYYTGSGDTIDNRVVEMFKEIGDQCGYLFQALNDLEAYVNPQKLMLHKGHLNLDYKSNKKNLAISALYDLANSSDKKKLQSANEKAILDMMEKYHVIDTMIMEINEMFNNMLNIDKNYKNTSVSDKWYEGFKHFLKYVKEFAESRLK